MKLKINESEMYSLYEFDGYEFNPNGSWTDVWTDVIEPLIETHIYDNNNYSDEAINDLDAIINVFMDEYGQFDSVRIACEKFFDENYI